MFSIKFLDIKLTKQSFEKTQCYSLPLLLSETILFSGFKKPYKKNLRN
jgi:hypothetical protein